jgi:hypothetical protein
MVGTIQRTLRGRLGGGLNEYQAHAADIRRCHSRCMRPDGRQRSRHRRLRLMPALDLSKPDVVLECTAILEGTMVALSEQMDRKVMTRLMFLLLVAGFAHNLFHEFGHWLTGTLLGNPMSMSRDSTAFWRSMWKRRACGGSDSNSAKLRKSSRKVRWCFAIMNLAAKSSRNRRFHERWTPFLGQFGGEG